MEQQEKKRQYLIIHGHFYQPPRENPWTERIERQRSAAPHHDWNEKITRECYLPMTRSRRLDENGRITGLYNNYEYISFNFGPTLLSWLEEQHPRVYEKILEADRTSAGRFRGHGNAIAQAYNHIIMPLATRRDQETQIRWGVYDFERRFVREPEGMWLPETAINDETLEMLIDFGFRFIILSPHQAARMRPIGSKSKWKDVSDGSIPTGFPYRCCLPRRGDRRSIDVFFYDAPISQDVSFNHLLRNGDKFADSIVAASQRSGNDLVVVATDGEIYGHHEPFADMALAYLIDAAGASRGLHLTNFGAYLDEHEPQSEVQLKPGPDGKGTSWSCAHGVGRWEKDCGCTTGGAPTYNQQWRSPLREGLNKLRDSLAVIFETAGGDLLKDPWKTRNDYIQLIEDRDPEKSTTFISEHAAHSLTQEEMGSALALLESQRNALLMFTSCGWFFNDIAGIETVQLLLYSARAIELAGEEQRSTLEDVLFSELKKAISNIPEAGTGVDIYEDISRLTAVTLPLLVTQYALTSYLFGGDHASEIFGYLFESLDETVKTFNEDVVAISTVKMTSPYTLETATFQYLLLIEHHARPSCYLKKQESTEDYATLKERCLELAAAGDRDGIKRTASDYFPGRVYQLRDLFTEDREVMLHSLARKQLETLHSKFQEIYLENRDLLHLLNEASITPPPSLLIPAQSVLTRKLVDEVERWERTLDPAGVEGIRTVVAEAHRDGIPIDKTSAAQSFSELILETIQALIKNLDPRLARSLFQFVELSDELGIDLYESEIQNEIYPILESQIPETIKRLSPNPDRNEDVLDAVSILLQLAHRFNFNVSHLKELVTAHIESHHR